MKNIEVAQHINRRHFLKQTSCGLGAAAMGLLATNEAQANGQNAQAALPGIPHHTPKAKRVISLFPHGVSSPDDPYSEFRELAVGDNVRFVGTVNIDETTTFFSPKVLDRIQLVTLRSPQLDGLREGLARDLG